VIAPDYPGFGNSDLPDPANFPYTFDKLSEVVEAFLNDRGFDHTDSSFRTTAVRLASGS
jgi:hypothetical protein